MPEIKVLSPHIADLIAAGEVVSRPASIVKELLENALDSGAGAVTCEITAGGAQYIRVTDDGCGIEKSMCPTAFLSHATSKISREEDLNSISTMGFRGEALASIAAVAKIDMFTLAEGNNIGCSLRIEGGKVISLEDAGCPRGTTIIVRDLFFNTPARRKFLKKDLTEAGHVQDAAQKCALSHPGVSLRFIRDGREQFHTPGDSSLRSAVHAVFGGEFFDGLYPAESMHEGFDVKGYISKPSAGRGSRGMQLFFVNGRPVRSATLTAALENGYKNTMMTGKHPACVLHITCPPSACDINVHPAKVEIRFADERAVFDAVYYAVKASLTVDETPAAQFPAVPIPAVPVPAVPVPAVQIPVVPIPAMPVPSPTQAETIPPPAEPAYFKPVISAADSEMQTILPMHQKVYIPHEIPPPEPVNPPEDKNWRFAGEVFGLYIIAETDDSLIFVDKHAAHERIIFERLKKSDPHSMSQMLLKPAVINLSGEATALLLANTGELSQLGFDIDEFGAGSIIVRGAPDGFDPEDIPPVIDELAEALATNRRADTTTRFEALLDSVACKAAIKSGGKQTPAELRVLLDEVMTNPDIRYCPHGRPVTMEIKKSRIEHGFGRT